MNFKSEMIIFLGILSDRTVGLGMRWIWALVLGFILIMQSGTAAVNINPNLPSKDGTLSTTSNKDTKINNLFPTAAGLTNTLANLTTTPIVSTRGHFNLLTGIRNPSEGPTTYDNTQDIPGLVSGHCPSEILVYSNGVESFTSAIEKDVCEFHTEFDPEDNILTHVYPLTERVALRATGALGGLPPSLSELPSDYHVANVLSEIIRIDKNGDG